MSQPKVVFFGSAPFALASLAAVRDHCVLVVSQPPKPTGRGMSMMPTPVARQAQEWGLPVETPRKCRAESFIERLATIDADLYLVAAYGQILPQTLLDQPKYGSINVHGSLLPRWRGAAPVQRAIMAGDKESGVTLMRMDAGLDTGDMIAKSAVAISDEMTAGELYESLASLGGQMVEEWLPKLLRGEYPQEKQDDESVTLAAKVTTADGQLTLDESATETYNRFRGVTPVPGAWLQSETVGRIKVKELQLRKSSPSNLAPGTIVCVRPNLEVAWKEGFLDMKSVQPEGKRAMSGSDFANGARLRTGDRLL
ncbi:MAG: methionyl-tRNA formyltransferase [Fimbriimonadaceae bacterium]|nr:methionyl-tRNA formyltransferase [Fimbriimonadaceae bacterium]